MFVKNYLRNLLILVLMMVISQLLILVLMVLILHVKESRTASVVGLEVDAGIVATPHILDNK